MSYREKSIWISLLVNAGVLTYYLVEITRANRDNLLNDAFMSDVFVNLVLIMVIFESILQTIVALLDQKEADMKADEMQTKISLLAHRNAYYALSSLIVMVLYVIWQVDNFSDSRLMFSVLTDGYNILNILVIGFVVTELVNNFSQVYYFRRGM